MTFHARIGIRYLNQNSYRSCLFKMWKKDNAKLDNFFKLKIKLHFFLSDWTLWFRRQFLESIPEIITKMSLRHTYILEFSQMEDVLFMCIVYPYIKINWSEILKIIDVCYFVQGSFFNHANLLEKGKWSGNFFYLLTNKSACLRTASPTPI